jgi:hypothetical protein
MNFKSIVKFVPIPLSCLLLSGYCKADILAIPDFSTIMVKKNWGNSVLHGLQTVTSDKLPDFAPKNISVTDTFSVQSMNTKSLSFSTTQNFLKTSSKVKTNGSRLIPAGTLLAFDSLAHSGNPNPEWNYKNLDYLFRNGANNSANEPEPGTILLLAVGLLGFSFSRKKVYQS